MLMSQLNLYRSDPDKWKYLANAPKQSELESGFDENEKSRHSLLIELQYDLKDEDEKLVRYLLEQEVIARNNFSISGGEDALLLSAYLLATFKNPLDIKLFYEAKHSNFDASCTINTEFLFYALGYQTKDFVQANFPEIYNDIGGYDSKADCDSSLADWWECLSNAYPNKIENESLYTLYQRSIYFNHYSLAREYLEQWKEATPESADKDNTLKYMYVELKDYVSAIELLKKELASTDSHEDRLVCYRSLLELYIKSEQSTDGFKTVEFIDYELQQFNAWKHSNLANMTLTQIFEFSLSIDDPKTAIKSFKIGYKWLKKINNRICCHGLEFAFETAKKHSLPEAIKLEELLLSERKKIDKELMPNSWLKTFLRRFF